MFTVEIIKDVNHVKVARLSVTYTRFPWRSVPWTVPRSVTRRVLRCVIRRRCLRREFLWSIFNNFRLFNPVVIFYFPQIVVRSASEPTTHSLVHVKIHKFEVHLSRLIMVVVLISNGRWTLNNLLTVIQVKLEWRLLLNLGTLIVLVKLQSIFISLANLCLFLSLIHLVNLQRHLVHHLYLKLFLKLFHCVLILDFLDRTHHLLANRLFIKDPIKALRHHCLNEVPPIQHLLIIEEYVQKATLPTTRAS